MGLTRQERQDRLWNKAIEIRDKHEKDRLLKRWLDFSKNCIPSDAASYDELMQLDKETQEAITKSKVSNAL